MESSIEEKASEDETKDALEQDARGNMNRAKSLFIL
jgi:hypothetical protein